MTLSEEQIRQAGFEWPKFPELGRRAVVVAGKIDLDATRQALVDGADYFRGELSQMQEFRDQWGASSSDVSDRRDEYVTKESELRDAAAYVGEIVRGVTGS